MMSLLDSAKSPAPKMVRASARFAENNRPIVVAKPINSETERQAIVRARIGQGLFEEWVSTIEKRCRVTGVDNPVHVVASRLGIGRSSCEQDHVIAGVAVGSPYPSCVDCGLRVFSEDEAKSARLSGSIPHSPGRVVGNLVARGPRRGCASRNPAFVGLVNATPACFAAPCPRFAGRPAAHSWSVPEVRQTCRVTSALAWREVRV